MSKITSNISSGKTIILLAWICGLCEIVFIPIGTFNHDNWFGIGCFVVAVGVIIFYISVYVYFMIKDPDRLQSEEFIREMELIKNNKEEYNDRE